MNLDRRDFSRDLLAMLDAFSLPFKGQYFSEISEAALNSDISPNNN